MQFSVVGAAISLALLAPNLLWMIFPPATIPSLPIASGAFDSAMGKLEMIGRILCFILPFITSFTFEGRRGTVSLIVMSAALAFYYAGWLRYFLAGREFHALYSPLFGIPVPLAIAPVGYMVGAVLASRSLPLLAGVIALAISHPYLSIGIWKHIR